ncbi:MAG: sugar ABC transporter permease [Bacteroidetes bacterium]|nr:sugar ABC transporter permease [Bacteroidota bacterium]
MKTNIQQSINTRNGLLFSLPWMVGFLLFILYPLCASLYYSFTNYNMFQAPVLVGFENYRNLFTDHLFYKSLSNTFFMTFVGGPLYIGIGILTAVMLNTKIKGLAFFRTIFYIPYILPIVATALLWIWVLNPQTGLMNMVLGSIGLHGPNWLADPRYTKISLIIIGAWRTGPIMILFLAALQDVPVTLYEAATIDGAGAMRRFFRITLPLLTPAILFQIIMQLIINFQYFTEAYIITGAADRLNQSVGGPLNSLLFYATYLYQNAFNYLKMGKASAMAWILFIITAVITLVIFKTSKKWVYYGD